MAQMRHALHAARAMPLPFQALQTASSRHGLRLLTRCVAPPTVQKPHLPATGCRHQKTKPDGRALKARSTGENYNLDDDLDEFPNPYMAQVPEVIPLIPVKWPTAGICTLAEATMHAAGCVHADHSCGSHSMQVQQPGCASEKLWHADQSAYSDSDFHLITASYLRLHPMGLLCDTSS